MKNKIIFLAILLIGLLGVGIVNANHAATAPVPQIQISPSTLVLSAPLRSVSVHSNIPYSQVDTCTLMLDGIAPYLTTTDARGQLVAKFKGDDVKAIVKIGAFTLTLTGTMKDGTPLSVSDKIRVKA